MTMDDDDDDDDADDDDFSYLAFNRLNVQLIHVIDR